MCFSEISVGGFKISGRIFDETFGLDEITKETIHPVFKCNDALLVQSAAVGLLRVTVEQFDNL